MMQQGKFVSVENSNSLTLFHSEWISILISTVFQLQQESKWNTSLVWIVWFSLPDVMMIWNHLLNHHID
jgi:hypothetical protein